MTVEDPADLLDYAASLLDAVGSNRAQVSAATALDCLYAAEMLEVAGARAAPLLLIDADPATNIRAAMTALARLDKATFAQRPVLDAARVARHALRRLA